MYDLQCVLFHVQLNCFMVMNQEGLLFLKQFLIKIVYTMQIQMVILVINKCFNHHLEVLVYGSGNLNLQKTLSVWKHYLLNVMSNCLEPMIQATEDANTELKVAKYARNGILKHLMLIHIHQGLFQIWE